MQIMEQPHVAISQKRRAFFVLARRYCGGPVLRTLSSLGAVTGLGVFWVAALKRDPRAPLYISPQALFYVSFFRDTTLAKRIKDPDTASGNLLFSKGVGGPPFQTLSIQLHDIGLFPFHNFSQSIHHGVH